MANELTSANAAQAIMKWVAAQYLPAVIGNLVMANLVNRDYESTLQNTGDTVNVPIAPEMAANNIAEAGSVTNQQNNLGNAQIVLNRHVEASFSIADVMKAIVSGNPNMAFMDSAVKALSAKLETDLLSVYPQLNAITAVGSGNTSITEATVDSAETSLFTAKVPGIDPKYLIVSGTAYGQLRQLPRFSEFQMTGPSGQPSPMITGQLAGVAGGTLKGLTVYRSQYVQKVSTTTYNLCFHRNAIALVMRRLPQTLMGTGAIQDYVEYGGYGFRVTLSYNSQTMQNQVTVDCLYGIGPLRNNFGLQVLS